MRQNKTPESFENVVSPIITSSFVVECVFVIIHFKLFVRTTMLVRVDPNRQPNLSKGFFCDKVKLLKNKILCLKNILPTILIK